jgi:hypothetical protein
VGEGHPEQADGDADNGGPEEADQEGRVVVAGDVSGVDGCGEVEVGRGAGGWMGELVPFVAAITAKIKKRTARAAVTMVQMQSV